MAVNTHGVELREHRLHDLPADHVIVGIDPGKLTDPSVLTIVHPVEYDTGRTFHVGHEPPWGSCGEHCVPEWRWRYEVRGQVALPLQQSYPTQARRCLELILPVMERPGISLAHSVIDTTGPGEGFRDTFDELVGALRISNITTCGLVIGSGEDDASAVKGHYTQRRAWASTTRLATRLRMIAQAGDLVLPDTADSRQLIEEARTFEFEVTASRRIRFGAASGKHDDRIMSLSYTTLWTPQTVTYLPGPFTGR